VIALPLIQSCVQLLTYGKLLVAPDPNFEYIQQAWIPSASYTTKGKVMSCLLKRLMLQSAIETLVEDGNPFPFSYYLAWS